jgi:hypothetical protein
MPLSEIIPSSIKIDKLLNRIEEGDIKIPAFQRGFVWNQDQVLELIDSIYNDYPIGGILLWNSLEKLNSTRNIGGFLIPDREPQYPVNYVLDGQQRLSAIYATFCNDRVEAPENNQYNIDPKIFAIYFDLLEKKFIAKEDVIIDHPNIKMSSLFDVENFFGELENIDRNFRKAARELQSKFQNYEVPIITTNKRTKEEVGIIFERINNTGTKLSTLDLMIAWTWSNDFHLREEIDDILETLENKGFGDTPEKIILQCLSGIIKKTTKTKDMLGLSPESVRAHISILKKSLEKTIDFLSTEVNILSRDFLPHSHQIVPLSFFFSQINSPTYEQNKIINKWFWKTSFSKRYSGSTDMKMNDDIAFFENVLKNDYKDISKYSYSIDENIITNQKFSKANPFTRAFLLLLSQKKPLNLVNGNKIDLGIALSKYNLKEYHHIFPRSYLKKKGLETSRINSICNFCFLPAESNKKISNHAPSNYIFSIVPPDAYSKILDSNLMPLKKEIYSKNQYDSFLSQRANILLQYLDQVIEK